MAISTYLSIITLNVNGLNTPIKRHRDTEWIKKQDPSICCLQETHFKPKDIHRLKVKGWKKIFHATNREKSRSCSTCIKQNRLQNKESHKRQRSRKKESLDCVCNSTLSELS